MSEHSWLKSACIALLAVVSCGESNTSSSGLTNSGGAKAIGGHSAVGGSSTGHPIENPTAAGGLNVGTSSDPNPAAGSTAAGGTEARADGGNPGAGGTAGTHQEPAAETDDALVSNGPWIPDLGDGTYKNPIIHADYSDPDVVRVGSDYYMTSSSFNCTPGLQILHSKDLINWRIIGYVFEQQPPYDDYVEPQTMNGVWAPSIRYHNDTFYITYGNPDKGIYLAKAKDPRGPWTLDNIYPGRGMIDPCPFWDSDGQGYVVHAWAGSRAGFNSTLTLRKLSADESSLSDEQILVIDGNKTAPSLFKVVEGPKMYKIGSIYYIFAPAGGVTQGWQMVLRSTSLEGPWEYKKVLEQGDTPVNGPHQGAWVTTPDEKESWFLHFQEKEMYGRVVHLQPVVWESGWPVMGNNGKPVLRHTKPAVGGTYPIVTPQTSDNFSSPTLGLQWQWYANSKQEWVSLTDNPGHLRLPAVPMPSSNYVKLPNLLLQKFPAESFSFTTKLTVQLQAEGEHAGLIVTGDEYSLIAVFRESDGLHLKQITGGSIRADEKLSENALFLRVGVEAPDAACTFEYSKDGTTYEKIGSVFHATRAKWIGAKVGVFASGRQGGAASGYADFDWVRVFDRDRYPNVPVSQ